MAKVSSSATMSDTTCRRNRITSSTRHGDDGEEAAPSPSPERVVFYEGCPGCAMERKKESNTGIPYKELMYVGITTFASSLPISSLFPFLYFMIEDMHVATKEQDIGIYAGLLGASYMIGRCFSSLFWGVVADRIGRRPVIAFSIFSVVIFNTLFGLSVKYWMAIASRFLLGALNGMLAPIKAYSVEICRPEHHAVGLSIVSTAWGIGLIVGPAIGGYFAQPAKQYPNMFSEKSIFGRFPYFLPCLCISLIALAVLVSCIWLPETLHMHKNLEGEVEMVEDSRADTHREAPHPEKSLYRNWPLMSSIIAYCVFTLHETAYSELFQWTSPRSTSSTDSPRSLFSKFVGASEAPMNFILEAPTNFEKRLLGEAVEDVLLGEVHWRSCFKWGLSILYSNTGILIAFFYQIFSLWAVSDRKYGGLSFSSKQVGQVLAVSGAGLLVYQLLFYRHVHNFIGSVYSIRIAAALSIPLLAGYPFMTHLSGSRLGVALYLATVVKSVLTTTALTGTSILQNNAVSQNQRGAANGISTTAMSFFKAIAPAGGGVLFSWAQRRQHAAFFPGDQIIFLFLNVAMFIGLLMTFKPFLALPEQYDLK